MNDDIRIMKGEIVEDIAEKVRVKKCRLIGVCGIPGAGKTTFARQLQQVLGKAIVVPMDGFHLYRKDLD